VQHQVIVIAHQTVRQNLRIKSLHRPRQHQQKRLSVSVILKNSVSTITP
jgi:hypothetical protein